MHKFTETTKKYGAMVWLVILSVSFNSHTTMGITKSRHAMKLMFFL